jgi:hypothetical protein
VTSDSVILVRDVGGAGGVGVGVGEPDSVTVTVTDNSGLA